MATKTFSKTWGAERLADGAVRFRLWATGQQSVTLRLDGQEKPMTRSEEGWFETTVSRVNAGAQYQFVLANGMAIPDPASRGQLAEVNGPSLVVDPES